MLGEKIKARRMELGMSISTAARAGGMNRNTWSNVERGDRDTEDYIYGGIERALRWKPGSIASILKGQNPQNTAPTRPTPRLSDAQYAAAEALYKSIRDNSNRSPLLRAMASASLEQLAAIRAADQAESKQESAS